MCALFYKNRLGIKKKCDKIVYLFCPNTGTKFREPYHSNHVIPHRDINKNKFAFGKTDVRKTFGCKKTVRQFK